MEKGLFLKRHEDAATQWFDDLVDLQGIKEMVSDVALRIAVPVLDNQLFERLLSGWSRFEEFKADFHPLVDAAIEKNWDSVELKAGQIMVKYINTPLGDPTEYLIIQPLLSFLVGLVRNQALKARAQDDRHGLGSDPEL